MPYALVIAGLILIVSGVRDTHSQLGAQLKADLTGSNNFSQYALALFAVGAVGYIDRLRAASTAFMALILIALVLSNKGFFTKFREAIDQGPEAPATNKSTAASVSDPAGSIDNLFTPLANSGTLLGKFINGAKKPPQSGGSGF